MNLFTYIVDLNHVDETLSKGTKKEINPMLFFIKTKLEDIGLEHGTDLKRVEEVITNDFAAYLEDNKGTDVEARAQRFAIKRVFGLLVKALFKEIQEDLRLYTAMRACIDMNWSRGQIFVTYDNRFMLGTGSQRRSNKMNPTSIIHRSSGADYVPHTNSRRRRSAK